MCLKRSVVMLCSALCLMSSVSALSAGAAGISLGMKARGDYISEDTTAQFSGYSSTLRNGDDMRITIRPAYAENAKAAQGVWRLRVVIENGADNVDTAKLVSVTADGKNIDFSQDKLSFDKVDNDYVITVYDASKNVAALDPADVKFSDTLVLVVNVSGTPLPAQSIEFTEIYGSVSRTGNGVVTGLEGARVDVKDTASGTIYGTNVEKGEFCMELPAGRIYTASFKKSGYATVEKTFSLNSTNPAMLEMTELCHLGDINRDGKVNTKDAMQMVQHLKNKVKLDSYQSKLADIDESGTVTVSDALRLIAMSNGKIPVVY